MRVLKAFAALLSYPRIEVQEAIADIDAAITDERALRRKDRDALQPLLDELRNTELLDLQERYVALFDRGRATSLNLYEHVHGDSRDRGQAMVDLMNIYRRGGLELDTCELPDHLPVLLEYLSTRPAGEVREMLGDCSHLLRSIGDALAQRKSPYATVLSALLGLAGERGLDLERTEAVADDNATLDQEWVEQPVLFGLGHGDARQGASVQPVRFVRKNA